MTHLIDFMLGFLIISVFLIMLWWVPSILFTLIMLGLAYIAGRIIRLLKEDI